LPNPQQLISIGATVHIESVHEQRPLVILCFVDRASLYNLVNKADLVHTFS